jgi:hypothetical protein
LNFWLPLLAVLKPIFASLIIFKCLFNLLLSIHHKRPMTNHRFINWLSSNQHETNSRFSRDLMYQVLIFRFLHYTTLVNFYFMFCTFTLILRLSFIKID